MKLKKNWNVYLIQHSHTDIGYTERQDKIIRYHYDFIRQAINILDDIHENGNHTYQGFVWQCENHWQVENFYEMASEEDKVKFEHYVHTGEIGLSGSYLNLTELVSEPVLHDNLADMEQYGKAIGHPITSAMCADINGMAWGYADALYDHGVTHLFSCLHPHHGMFPLYKKVLPFYWESPQGKQILVWNGDHYHLGNEMFLSPHGGTTYMVHDEFSSSIYQNTILSKNREDTKQVETEIAMTRIERYLSNLEEEGYPYSFVPLMVSGAITDNAPPGKEIARRVNELNEKYNGRIVFQMVNLEQFFDIVKLECSDIPAYRGDWTDWWADGVGSTPAEVKLYRDAVRKYNLCKKLDPDCKLGKEELMHLSSKELMLYAEHTWGYSSSVSEPWESLVSALELKKGAYAVNANTHIAKNLDQILAAKGEVSIRQDKPQHYCIVNPHDREICTKALLFIEFWEYIDGVRFDNSMPIEVADILTGEILPSQVKGTARATQVEIEISMKAKEERNVQIRLVNQSFGSTKNHAHIGAEGVCDLMETDGFRIDEDQIETEHLIVKMKDKTGIYSIISKCDGQDVVWEETISGAFSGIYEVTDIVGSACETRRRMGRNRKSKGTRRYESILIDRKIVENGTIYAAAALEYELKGTGMYTVLVKVYKNLPKIEIMIRVHKESRWEPENLYVALPFTSGEESVSYVDKTGCIIRPGIDQLPGSCQDFYLIQNAVLWQSKDKNVAVLVRDTPLVSIGSLEAGPVILSDGKNRKHNRSEIYSWPMNNFWETNFKVNLGGFYEFAYTLLVEGDKTPEEMYQICEAEQEGLLACYAD